MDVNIIDKSNWEKTLEVTVPYEYLEPEFEKAYREYKKEIKLGGFRKGKVPVSLIKKMFGKEIEPKVAESKIPDILDEISKEKELKPISPAKMEDFSYSANEGLKFKVFLEVVPKIEIEKYKELSFEREVYQVEEEDVIEALENLREQFAVITNIDHEAQPGHHIVADFQKLDTTGVPIIGEKYENRSIELIKNDSGTDNNLIDQLLGVKVGETRYVKLPFIDSQNQQQIESYSVTIKEIKEKELPDLDDEFAKDVGDFENLEVLRARLRIEIDNKFKNKNEDIFVEKIIDELVKSNQFEVPEPMVSNYLDKLVEQLKKNSKEEVDELQLREHYRSNTIRNLKWAMIRDEILKLEKIEVTDSEIEDHIEKLVEANKKDSLQIKNYYRTKENRNRLEEELLGEKVIQLLINHAKVDEKIVNRKDLKKESKFIV